MFNFYVVQELSLKYAFVTFISSARMYSENEIQLSQKWQESAGNIET